MTLGIGVIGAGAIGRDHARRIENALAGGKVVAVNDIDGAASVRAIEELGLKATNYPSAEELTAADEVDAVLVTSSAATHEAFVLQAIAAGKPVFCEKPLAPSIEGARRIVDAEMAAGRRLVQLGFMRRFDPGYRALKQVVERELGPPLMVHAAHRNAASGPGFSTPMAIHETAIHEIDVLRWLLNQDYVSAQVIFPRSSRNAPKGTADPQIVLLETTGGVRIDIEIFVNCTYGYDIQCEVVGEEGLARLPGPEAVTLRKKARLSQPIPTDWMERFIAAYDVELQFFLDNARAGSVSGPSSWDGYVAAVVAEACVEAQGEPGRIVPISLPARPPLYD